MTKCNLCNTNVPNGGQVDHYVDGHNIEIEKIWVTRAIVKNNGEVVCTYKRMAFEVAAEMGLTL